MCFGIAFGIYNLSIEKIYKLKTTYNYGHD